MTIIAWDGTTLAADKAATHVGYKRTVTKLYRVQEGIVAFAGSGPHALALLAWFRAGRDIATWPKAQEDGQTAADAFFVDHTRTLWRYSTTPYPERCEDAFDATGAGRDYALAAMHLGHSARVAVEVACALDNTCGNGIDSMSPLPDESTTTKAAHEK